MAYDPNLGYDPANPYAPPPDYTGTPTAPSTSTGTQPPSSTTTPYAGTTPDWSGIQAAYQTYLGRQASPTELATWANNPNYKTAIQNSKEAQDWAWAQAQGPQAVTDYYTSHGITPPGGTNTTTTTTNTASQAPTYVNTSDPIQAAVWAAFQQKGMVPRDQADFQYWVDRINQTGGWTQANQNYWLSRMAQSAGGVGDYSGAPEAGGSGVGYTYAGLSIPQNPGFTPVPQPASGLAFQSNSDALFKLLMGRAGQSLNIDPHDPIIANQVNAFKAQEQAGTRNYLNQLAEAEGPQANLGMETRIANQQQAQATGQMQAQLMQNELTARRQEIAQSLQEWGSLLTSQQQMALQQQLAYYDAAIRQNQAQLQNSQFYAGLGMQGQQLAMQYDQFLRNLGLQAQYQSWYQDRKNQGLTA